MARRAPKRPDGGTLDAATRVAVIVGPEAYLRAEKQAELRAALRETHGEDGLEVIRYDGDSAAAADVLDECRSFDLMGRHKLVVVDNADKFASGDNRPLLERYASNPVENATLVLTGPKWNKGKHLDDAIRKVGAFVACEPLKDRDATQWAQARCKSAHGVTLDPNAANALVELLGPDLGRIEAELSKLALVPDGGRVTEAMVRGSVGNRREEEVWGIQRALASGSASEAMEAVVEALEISGHAPTLVRYNEIDLARKLHALARVGEGGGNPASVMGPLRVFSHRDETLQAARGMGSSNARRLLRWAIEMDMRAKTGRSDDRLSAERVALGFSRGWWAGVDRGG